MPLRSVRSTAARVQSGQWWRLWTALTLHVSAEHLFANLAGGVWFGILAARQLGVGTAWFLIVTGAALANGLEAQWAPPGYRSVGASTAVFTALGLMAAHSWQIRFPLRQSWAKRWAPLVAGTVLLGWLGTAGEGTDIVAHLLGFTVGGLLGGHGRICSVERALQRVPQWLSGLARWPGSLWPGPVPCAVRAVIHRNVLRSAGLCASDPARGPMLI